VWGGLHGIAIVIHGLWRQLVRSVMPQGFALPSMAVSAWRAICIFLTFHLVSFLWVPFYHRDFSQALDVFRALLTSTRPVYQLDLVVVVAVACGMGANFAGRWICRIYLQASERSSPIGRWAITCALAYLILRASPDTMPPFIYFQF